MYGKHSPSLNGWQNEFVKGKSLRNPLNRYEDISTSSKGRLGSPVINPFDGGFGNVAAPAQDMTKAALQKEVADASAAVSKASHLVATNPAAGHAQLKTAQDRLAAAAEKLSAYQQQKKGAATIGGMPQSVLMFLIALAAVGGYMFFKQSGR